MISQTHTTATSSPPEDPAKGPSTLTIPKPFFIMDWLEDLAADQDLLRLAELLKTPQKALSVESSFPFHEVAAWFRNEDRDDEWSGGASSDDSEEDACPRTPKSSNCTISMRNPALFPSPSASSQSSEPPERQFPIFPRNLFSEGHGTRLGAEPNEGEGRSSQSIGAPAVPATTLRRRRQRTPASRYQRAVALGDAWNAKGLRKAKEGSWEDALACWDSALEIRVCLPAQQPGEVRGRTSGVANTHNNRGIALGKLGCTAAALEALGEALSIREDLLAAVISHQPITGEAQEESASQMTTLVQQRSTARGVLMSTLHNIANVHQESGNLPDALSVLQEARSFFARDDGDDPRTAVQVGRICVAMGHVYYEAGQWIDARDAYRDALDVYEAAPDPEAAWRDELADLRRYLLDLDHRCPAL